MEDFVLDCSVTVAWCFADESTRTTDDLLESFSSERRAYTPAIWPFEVTNVLLVGERRERISPKDSSRFLTLLWTLPIYPDLDVTPSTLQRIIDIGRNHQISAYDASYMELALRRGLSMATLDNKMKTVAEQLNIPCLL